MAKLAIIGDLHGDVALHIQLMRKHPFTLQIGDCGFSYDYMKDFDPQSHLIMGGNHDNYDKLTKLPHYVGDYGWVRDTNIFFVRGAMSMDKALRIEGRDWWPDEELSTRSLNAAIDLYTNSRPSTVVTHDAPESVCKLMLAQGLGMFGPVLHKSSTVQALQAMFDAHPPDLWVFGHWHKSFEVGYASESNPDFYTRFKALGIGEVFEVAVEKIEDSS